MPAEIETIGYGTFAYCSSLKAINIPEKVKMESDWWGTEGTTTGPFEYCSSLKEITINSNRKELDWKIFKNCSALEVITIPKTITEIAEEAFADVQIYKKSNLKKIHN